MQNRQNMILKLLATLPLFFALTCCATTSHLPDKTLLDFIEDGKTTKDEAILKLGQPAGAYENERILTFLIGQKDKGYFVGFQWIEAKYSLVLIFDDNKILQKHSLVPVR